MKNLYLLISLLFAFQFIKSQDIKVVSGKIERIENFKSAFVTERNIDVWLPEGYSSEKKYAVLYMHDGHMLFDESITWNKQSWNVDDVVSKLLKQGKVRDFIVVGIWNGGKTRHSDYFPQKPFESLTNDEQELIFKAVRNNGNNIFDTIKINSDNYLKFIVKELKPIIDKKYSTYTDFQNTFVAGSSMGGLISMYAICEYPDIFGGAACISTHWPGIFEMENNPIPGTFYKYLQNNLPNPNTHKFYFDYGTKTLDKMYEPLQKEVDKIMKLKGFTSKNTITKKFSGADHSEKSWNKRLNIPLEFLLGK